MTQAALIPTAQAWSVELFKRFWDNPTVDVIRRGGHSVITDDIVGVWPHGAVLRGRHDYIEGLVRLLTAIPDFRADVMEHASSGEFTFIRWRATGTYQGAPFVAIGADRVRLRDQLIAENLIMSDHSVFRVVAATGADDVTPAREFSAPAFPA